MKTTRATLCLLGLAMLLASLTANAEVTRLRFSRAVMVPAHTTMVVRGHCRMAMTNPSPFDRNFKVGRSFYVDEISARSHENNVRTRTLHISDRDIKAIACRGDGSAQPNANTFRQHMGVTLE
jgi:hypothetical protein